MERFRQQLLRCVVNPKLALITLLLITLISHLPTGFGSFVADDYMQWAMLQGSTDLHAMGFDRADPAKPLLDKLLDGFHFFSFESGSLDAYKHYGNVFWWAGDSISMVPFRPLAAFTHWVDYNLAGDRLWLHQVHSLAYFFLLAWLLYRLYRMLLPDVSADAMGFGQRPLLAVAFLATFLFIVDFSLTRSFAWVVARNSYLACAIGVASLICFVNWRRQQRWLDLAASLLLFLLALLTAEAAVSVAAYVGAYILCLERQPLLKKVVPLLPYIAVILLWRSLYNLGGFGALNIGQYIDPAHAPLDFLVNFASVFPLIVFGQITGIDTLVIFVHPQQQWLLSVLAWLVAVAGVLVIWPFLRRSRIDRFWFTGALVAAIPGTALISAESRTITFVSIGFFYLLARLLVHLYLSRRNWLRRWSFRLVFLWHGLLPLVVACFMTSGLSGFSQLSRQYQSIEGAIEAGKTGLVVVNPDSSGMLYYRPFEWAFRGFAVPARMNVLTTGLETIDLVRTGEREFNIVAPAGMPLTHRAPVGSLQADQPRFSTLYSGLYTHSFFNRPGDSPAVGSVIHNADFRVTVLETNTTGPVRLRIEFVGPEHPDAKVWQWYDWKQRQYQRMEPLAIGESRRFTGPFDVIRN